jgi:hypothetical protein
MTQWGLSRKEQTNCGAKLEIYGLVPEVVTFWVITLLHLPPPICSPHLNPKQYMDLCAASPKVEVQQVVD